MKYKRFCKALAQYALLAGAVSLATVANATIVQFQTSLGNFEVNLYDEKTPETVANFLAYLEAGTYNNTIVHRSVPSFVIQSGGFYLDNDGVVKRSEALWSPINEPVFSNVKGTIAMAKQGGDPNSATNQWFFNLADNSANLDAQNGGFTVFGEVMGNGMDVVNAIAAVPIYNLDNNVFSSTPLRDYSSADDKEDLAQNPGNYLVLIENIVVLDSAIDTAADLSPPLNTSITNPVTVKKKKGGALNWVVLLGLCAWTYTGLRRQNRAA